MTYHDRALLGAIELKDAEGDDAAGIVTKALDELRGSVDERLKAVETKADASALIKRIDGLEARLNRPAVHTDPVETKSVEQKSFGVYLRRADAGLAALGDIERKALTVATDASAGYLAPETFGNEILKALVEHSPIRAYAKVVSVAGPEIKYPRRTAGTNATWVAETDARTESTLTYGQMTIAPGELATWVEISKQLLEDASYDIEGELRDALAEDFGVKEGAAFVSGDGVNKPKGLLAAGNGIAEVLSGAASTLGATPGDTLINVFSALPTAHAQNGAWLMNRSTLATIRKVKDSQGAYIWQPGLQAGQPSTLLGRPVIEAVDMPAIAAGAFPIVFGDFSGYRIVDRVGMSILVDPFTRAKNGLNVVHARMRVGGDVTHPDRFVKLKVSA